MATTKRRVRPARCSHPSTRVGAVDAMGMTITRPTENDGNGRARATETDHVDVDVDVDDGDENRADGLMKVRIRRAAARAAPGSHGGTRTRSAVAGATASRWGVWGGARRIACAYADVPPQLKDYRGLEAVAAAGHVAEHPGQLVQGRLGGDERVGVDVPVGDEAESLAHALRRVMERGLDG